MLKKSAGQFTLLPPPMTERVKEILEGELIAIVWSILNRLIQYYNAIAYKKLVETNYLIQSVEIHEKTESILMQIYQTRY